MPLWVRGEVVRLQGMAERPLVLQPARRRQPGALLHVEAGHASGPARRPPTAPRCSCSGGPASTRPRASSSSTSAASRRPRPSARRSRSSSGSRRCSTGTGCSIWTGSAPLPALRGHPRRGHQHGRRRAARHHHRSPAPLAVRPAARDRRPGAGRRRRGGAGPRARLVNRLPGVDSASSAAAAAAARTWPPSTPRRSAARSPPCGCRPSRPSATRPTSRSPTSSPTVRAATPSAAAELGARRPSRGAPAARRARRAPGRRRSAAGPGSPPSGSSAPATGCRPPWPPCSSAGASRSPASRRSSTR